MIRYILIFCLLLGGCTFIQHFKDSIDYLETGEFPCPEGEVCLDLGPKMAILHTMPKKRGWRAKGCVHSVMIDKHTDQDLMYCEHCDKNDHQMWMIYDYKKEKWFESSHFFTCGTILDKWTLDHFNMLEGDIDIPND